MADFNSREHTTNLTNFLAHFSSKFKPQKDRYWNLCLLKTGLISRVISELSNKPLCMPLWRQLPKKGCNILRFGRSTLPVEIIPVPRTSLTAENGEKIQYLAAFGSHVQCNNLSKNKQEACVKTVEVSLRAVTKKLKLDGQQHPLVTAQGSYVQAIKQLLACYKKRRPSSSATNHNPLEIASIPKPVQLKPRTSGARRLQTRASLSSIFSFEVTNIQRPQKPTGDKPNPSVGETCSYGTIQTNF